ncbi:hypothetical protein VTL71DRAFT_2449 [Oculimacula yallundae]|uniref:FAD-binding PCMH-type domain-containing protein n=1 Tax=Oculimacula yallundae TaxID=86028 RepID=A0ABR4C8V3_9HELO
MPSSTLALTPWKQLLVLALVAIFHAVSASPIDFVSTNNNTLTRSCPARFKANITQARVEAAKASTNNNTGAACCMLLKDGLGQMVLSSNSTAYRSSISAIWSVQAQSVVPGCIVSPKTTSDVSQTIRVLNQVKGMGLQCNFAIRSGGHTPWVGSSSIQNGVQIDLAALNQVTVASDQKTTAIGPGARWVDVYSKLDALSLTVAGGRTATVGVGGLVTGGGISFFSARYGFTADTVTSYEVVLSNGSVVIASATSEPELFFALKGGSNNFGIVTRFDLVTFPAGQLWGGQIISPISTKNQSLPAFVKFTNQTSYDVYGALIHSFAWTNASGWLVVNFMTYTQPVVNPPVFQETLAIQPRFISTTRLSNHSDLTRELATATTAVKNQIFYTSTWSNDLQTLSDIAALSDKYLQTVATVPGLIWPLTFQPLVTAITSKSASTGGNALGLDPSNGNLVLCLLNASWDNRADEPAVVAAVTGFFAEADALAASRGKLNAYKYLNYADKTQQPIKGYGSANVDKLRAASKKYDPTGMFQTMVPGGFKLQ